MKKACPVKYEMCGHHMNKSLSFPSYNFSAPTRAPIYSSSLCPPPTALSQAPLPSSWPVSPSLAELMRSQLLSRKATRTGICFIWRKLCFLHLQSLITGSWGWVEWRLHFVVKQKHKAFPSNLLVLQCCSLKPLHPCTCGTTKIPKS